MPALTVELDPPLNNWLVSLKKKQLIKSKGELARQCLIRMRETIDRELQNSDAVHK